MIILASSSPRRRILLRRAGLDYRSVRPGYVEKDPPGLGPRALVLRHAKGKASSVRIRDGVVLAADTVVGLNGRVIGKPRNRAHAYSILKGLQGRWHDVWTGVAIWRWEAGRCVRRQVFAQKTQVLIRPMSPRQIRSYLKSIQPLDKAGAYAIQSRRSIVAAWRGSLSNAVGLPMETLQKRLKADR